MVYNPEKDLTAIQNIVMADNEILKLLDLEGKSRIEIAKKIIKRSQWDDLADSNKRLCIYSLPSRTTRNSILFDEIIEIDCHVPASRDFEARQVIGRAVDVLNNKRIDGRYLNFKGSLGELSTMQGFYCFGCRFGYYSPF